VFQRVWHVRNALKRRGAELQHAPPQEAVPAEDV
jgi:hypothetical protein